MVLANPTFQLYPLLSASWLTRIEKHLLTIPTHAHTLTHTHTDTHTPVKHSTLMLRPLLAKHDELLPIVTWSLL